MTAKVLRRTEVQMCVGPSITRSVCLQQLQSILGARGGGGQLSPPPPPPHSPSLCLSLLIGRRSAQLTALCQAETEGEREIEGDGGFSDGVSCHFLFLYPQSVHL